MIRLQFLFLLTILICEQASASLTNIIVNYTRNEYKAGSQNWQIEDYNNFIYFANKMGVLEYNGAEWKLYTLNNKTEVRSIRKSPSTNRLYVAGINEIGFLSPSENGSLKYTQINDLNNSFMGSVWKIFEVRNTLYFITDKCIVRYENNSIKVLESPEKIDCSNLIDNTLYIGTPAGIYTLAGDKFVILNNSELLSGAKIRSIEKFDKDILIATSGGLFVANNSTVTPFSTEADLFIKKNALFCLAINDKYLAIGTILNGGVLLDKKGKVQKYFNENHGLQNNTILSMCFDAKNNLWLGLDNGIDYLLTNDNFTNLYPNSSYGAGFAAALYKDQLYIGTNRGVFTCKWPIASSENGIQLRMLENTQGQVWSIRQINEYLFIGHDKGLFIVSKEGTHFIDNFTGVWMCKPMKKFHDSIWVSTYTGFYVLSKEDNKWKSNRIENSNESIYNFAEDKNGRLWVNGWNKNIALLSFNKDYSEVIESKAIESIEKKHIVEINNEVLFCDGLKFYNFNPSTNEFNSTNILPYSSILSGTKLLDVKTDYNKTWVLTDKAICIVDSLSGSQSYFHNLPLISNFEEIIPINDSSAFIGNESGITLWEKRSKDTTRTFVQILSINTTKPIDSLVFKNNFADFRPNIQLAFINNAITVEYLLTDYSAEETVLYRTRLDNSPWSTYSTNNIKQISDISVGKHTFMVEAIKENKIYKDSISFEILPPWYRTSWAYLIYSFFIISFAFSVFKLDDLRIRRKEKELRLVKEQELKEQDKLHREQQLLKQQEIVALQKKQLEMNLKHKSMELASTTFNMIRKNEILGELKSDIEKIISEERNKNKSNQQLVQLIEKIDNNIEHDDGLKKFEEHFDLVHNNFMQKLSEQYTNLTLNERKMCAFIRMELTSKEISPLLNISIRGVETMRYRLRKKFNLDRDESLTTFLKQL